MSASPFPKLQPFIEDIAVNTEHITQQSKLMSLISIRLRRGSFIGSFKRMRLKLLLHN